MLVSFKTFQNLFILFDAILEEIVVLSYQLKIFR